MFDKRLAVTCAALAAIAALSFFITRPPQSPDITPIVGQVSGIERDEPQPAPQKTGDYQYLLKERDGRVAVFHAGESEPEMVLDVFVKYLPDFDRAQMKDGIPVKDYNELVARIEDYIS